MIVTEQHFVVQRVWQAGGVPTYRRPDGMYSPRIEEAEMHATALAAVIGDIRDSRFRKTAHKASVVKVTVTRRVEVSVQEVEVL